MKVTVSGTLPSSGDAWSPAVGYRGCLDYKSAGSRAGVDGIVNGGYDLISAVVAGDVG